MLMSPAFIMLLEILKGWHMPVQRWSLHLNGMPAMCLATAKAAILQNFDLSFQWLSLVLRLSVAGHVILVFGAFALQAPKSLVDNFSLVV